MDSNQLCRIAVGLRKDYEADGYVLYSRDVYPFCRRWYYAHYNGNRITIELHLDTLVLKVYKNARLIQTYK